MRFNCIVEHVKYCIVNLYTPITKKKKKACHVKFSHSTRVEELSISRDRPTYGPMGPGSFLTLPNKKVYII